MRSYIFISIYFNYFSDTSQRDYSYIALLLINYRLRSLANQLKSFETIFLRLVQYSLFPTCQTRVYLFLNELISERFLCVVSVAVKLSRPAGSPMSQSTNLMVAKRRDGCGQVIKLLIPEYMGHKLFVAGYLLFCRENLSCRKEGLYLANVISLSGE